MSTDKRAIAYNPAALYRAAGFLAVTMVCLRIALVSDDIAIILVVWAIPAMLAGYCLGTRGGLTMGAALGLAAGICVLNVMGPPYPVNKVWLLIAAGTFLGALPKVQENMTVRSKVTRRSGTVTTPVRAAPDELIAVLTSMVGAHDVDLKRHNDQVANLALTVGRGMGLPTMEMYYLGIAALLHDIGKIGIAGSLLAKTGPLSSAEREIVRQHPELGEQILKPLRMLKGVVPSVRGHHERWNGTGYPDGLKENQIPLYARIIAVCDVYVSLVSRRSYRAAWPARRVLDFMEDSAGVLFDPDVVQVFDVTVRPDGEQLPEARDMRRQIQAMLE